MRTRCFRKASLALAAFWVACGPAAAPPPLPGPAATEPIAAPGDFSADAAWGHLGALVAAGVRAPGTPGAAAARAHLAGALREQGLEVEEQRAEVLRGSERLETVNLVARIPGASRDVLLLVAPYDSPAGGDPGAEAGGTGAALVVELARALGARRPEYTIWVALVEGDALALSGAVPRSAVGTGALASALAAQGALERVRLAVYFDRVAGPDLRIARDLTSQRSAREDFWAAARRLGRGDVFPPDASFEAVEDGHLALVDAGLRRTLAIGASRGDASADASGSAAGDAPDDASRASLGAVGTVSLEALSTISGRLAKIDRFVKSPLSASAPPPAAAPTAATAPEATQGGAEAAPPPPPAPEAALPPADPAPAPPEADPAPPEAAAAPPVAPLQVDPAR